ncbi:MAG: GH92 family glycosyl hydrolase [Bryobacterales bacterium]|nr:GH92 family glycosyl hydrolase [Bryobacterales bacterium]
MIRALILTLALASLAAPKEPVDYVDPNIGGISHLLVPALPNVQYPHGIARLAPVTPTGVKDRYLADQVFGFRAGASILMPFTGPVPADPARYASLYDHDQETATPYYYSAWLEDTGIQVEYTVTHSVAYYRFTYPENTTPAVLFRGVTAPQFTLQPPNAIQGAEDTPYRDSRLYFHAEFSRPYATSGQKPNAVWAAGFDTRALEIKIGFSYISPEQARRNIAREIPDWDFARVKAEARAVWNRELGKIEISGGTEQQRTIFYTGLYRSVGRPTNLVEGDRYYSGADKQVHPAEGRGFYAVNNPWGSFRSMYPLQLLLDPQRQVDVVRTYIRIYQQSGWMQPYIRQTMIGQHQTAIVTDVWAKGYRDFDLAKAYEGLRKNRMESTLIPWRRGPATSIDRAYQEHGFVPALAPGEQETIPTVDSYERRQAVAVTLEAAYDDWCMAQLARALGKDADLALFSRRALNYRKLFDPQTGFMRPKTADGRWIEPFDPTWSGGQGGRAYYAEMNAWIYTWHVPHDVPGLIGLFGGPGPFTARLDQLFREQYAGNRKQGGTKYAFLAQFPDQTGLIGQYAHGNEPNLHIPYLYNYAGEPWMTQRKVRQILQTQYAAAPLGYAGDEDDGDLGSWYVLSAMGFYPVSPGRPVYDIGSPLFDEVRLHMSGGKVFTLRANHVSTANKYIQSATLNGRPLNAPWFDHQTLAEGGTLVLEMGPRPNREWGKGSANSVQALGQLDSRAPGIGQKRNR